MINGMPGNMPQQTPGPQMPEQPMDEHEEARGVIRKQKYEEELGKVEAAKKKANADRYISKNKIRKVKLEMLKEVYDSMKAMGVDPSDINSVGEFLQVLEQQDPDLVRLFEMVINTLTPEDDIPGGQEQSAQQEPNLMDQQTDLTNKIMR